MAPVESSLVIGERCRSLAAAWASGPASPARLGFGVADTREAHDPRGAVQLVADLAAGRHGAGPWFGGLAFPGARGSAAWRGFPHARFVRPEHVVEVPFELLAARADGPPPRARALEADWPGWERAVEAAREHIRAGRLEKVVLARVATLVAGRPWDPAAVLGALCATTRASRYFLLRGAAAGTLVGATPEALLRWSGGQVAVDALAGSAPPGGAFGDKEEREHRVVVRGVVEALRGRVERLEVPPGPRVMDLPYIRHLHTPVRGALRDAAGLADLLQRLFPTAAVAGAPRSAALEFLARHERFDRGWYAGAVGCIAPGEVDLAVALRCVLLEGSRARVYAGAGIVEGSDARAEWDETARKAAPALGALREVPGGP